MKLPLFLLTSAALLSTVHAQLPDPAELLGLRPKHDHGPAHHHGHPQPAPAPAVQVTTTGNTVFLHRAGQAPAAIYQSNFNVRGALTSPDGKLVAVSVGTGSAGDWIVFLHRIDQAKGSRYISEPLDSPAQKFVDFIYKLDPALKVQPRRLRITPVSVFPGGSFQFALTGDNDLLGRTLTLVVQEDAQPVLFEGCDQ